MSGDKDNIRVLPGTAKATKGGAEDTTRPRPGCVLCPLPRRNTYTDGDGGRGGGRGGLARGGRGVRFPSHITTSAISALWASGICRGASPTATPMWC